MGVRGRAEGRGDWVVLRRVRNRLQSRRVFWLSVRVHRRGLVWSSQASGYVVAVRSIVSVPAVVWRDIFEPVPCSVLDERSAGGGEWDCAGGGEVRACQRP